jgi:hypothetical protein
VQRAAAFTDTIRWHRHVKVVHGNLPEAKLDTNAGCNYHSSNRVLDSGPLCLTYWRGTGEGSMLPTSKRLGGLAEIRRHCLAGVGIDVSTPWRRPLPTGGGRKDIGPGIILPSSVRCSVRPGPGPGSPGWRDPGPGPGRIPCAFHRLCVGPCLTACRTDSAPPAVTARQLPKAAQGPGDQSLSVCRVNRTVTVGRAATRESLRCSAGCKAARRLDNGLLYSVPNRVRAFGGCACWRPAARAHAERCSLIVPMGCAACI